MGEKWSLLFSERRRPTWLPAEAEVDVWEVIITILRTSMTNLTSNRSWGRCVGSDHYYSQNVDGKPDFQQKLGSMSGKRSLLFSERRWPTWLPAEAEVDVWEVIITSDHSWTSMANLTSNRSWGRCVGSDHYYSLNVDGKPDFQQKKLGSMCGKWSLLFSERRWQTWPPTETGVYGWEVIITILWTSMANLTSNRSWGRWPDHYSERRWQTWPPTETGVDVWEVIITILWTSMANLTSTETGVDVWEVIITILWTSMANLTSNRNWGRCVGSDHYYSLSVEPDFQQKLGSMSGKWSLLFSERRWQTWPPTETGVYGWGSMCGKWSLLFSERRWQTWPPTETGVDVWEVIITILWTSMANLTSNRSWGRWVGSDHYYSLNVDGKPDLQQKLGSMCGKWSLLFSERRWPTWLPTEAGVDVWEVIITILRTSMAKSWGRWVGSDHYYSLNADDQPDFQQKLRSMCGKWRRWQTWLPTEAGVDVWEVIITILNVDGKPDLQQKLGSMCGKWVWPPTCVGSDLQHSERRWQTWPPTETGVDVWEVIITILWTSMSGKWSLLFSERRWQTWPPTETGVDVWEVIITILWTSMANLTSNRNWGRPDLQQKKLGSMCGDHYYSLNVDQTWLPTKAGVDEWEVIITILWTSMANLTSNRNWGLWVGSDHYYSLNVDGKPDLQQKLGSMCGKWSLLFSGPPTEAGVDGWEWSLLFSERRWQTWPPTEAGRWVGRDHYYSLNVDGKPDLQQVEVIITILLTSMANLTSNRNWGRCVGSDHYYSLNADDQPDFQQKLRSQGGKWLLLFSERRWPTWLPTEAEVDGWEVIITILWTSMANLTSNRSWGRWVGSDHYYSLNVDGKPDLQQKLGSMGGKWSLLFSERRWQTWLPTEAGVDGWEVIITILWTSMANLTSNRSWGRWVGSDHYYFLNAYDKSDLQQKLGSMCGKWSLLFSERRWPTWLPTETGVDVWEVIIIILWTSMANLTSNRSWGRCVGSDHYYSLNVDGKPDLQQKLGSMCGKWSLLFSERRWQTWPPTETGVDVWEVIITILWTSMAYLTSNRNWGRCVGSDHYYSLNVDGKPGLQQKLGSMGGKWSLLFSERRWQTWPPTEAGVDEWEVIITILWTSMANLTSNRSWGRWVGSDHYYSLNVDGNLTSNRNWGLWVGSDHYYSLNVDGKPDLQQKLGSMGGKWSLPFSERRWQTWLPTEAGVDVWEVIITILWTSMANLTSNRNWGRWVGSDHYYSLNVDGKPDLQQKLGSMGGKWSLLFSERRWQTWLPTEAGVDEWEVIITILWTSMANLTSNRSWGRCVGSDHYYSLNVDGKPDFKQKLWSMGGKWSLLFSERRWQTWPPTEAGVDGWEVIITILWTLMTNLTSNRNWGRCVGSDHYYSLNVDDKPDFQQKLGSMGGKWSLLFSERRWQTWLPAEAGVDGWEVIITILWTQMTNLTSNSSWGRWEECDHYYSLNAYDQSDLQQKLGSMGGKWSLLFSERRWPTWLPTETGVDE